MAQTAAGFLLRGRATPDELQTAMKGLPGSTTVAMTLDLWDLAVAIRADDSIVKLVLDTPPDALARAYRDGTLPLLLQKGLARYLDCHGHRAVAEVDLGLPRWSDDPTFLFGALANYLRAPAERLTPDAARQRAVEDGEAAVSRLASLGGVFRRAAVKWLFGRARELVGVREQWKDDLTRIWARARDLLKPVGKALVAAARLDTTDDIFFVSLPEARSALGSDGADLRGLIRTRRATYAAELRRRHVPAMLLSDGTEPEVETGTCIENPGGPLLGIPASPGKARGRARVLFEPMGARLDPGEVLVAPSTDPGWTPLFMTAGALVMEKGGVISHGAVIAREYGIPAVVGVAGALKRIRSGDMIEVDGSKGWVTLGPVEPGVPPEKIAASAKL